MALWEAQTEFEVIFLLKIFKIFLLTKKNNSFHWIETSSLAI